MGGRAGDLWPRAGLDPGDFQRRVVLGAMVPQELPEEDGEHLVSSLAMTGILLVFRYLRLGVKRDRESSTLAMGSRSGAGRPWESSEAGNS